MKIDFDALLTWHKNNYNYINILPRMTIFVSPIFKNSESNELIGRYYGLQIGWLVFECSIEIELKKGGSDEND